MPNWCENRLQVLTREPEMLVKFIKYIAEGESQFSFNKIIPIEGDWYKFCIDNWGTKWEPEIQSFDIYSTDCSIIFLTAWNPPIGIIKKLSKKFPKITFVLSYEEGNGLVGIFEAKNGKFKDKYWHPEDATKT